MATLFEDKKGGGNGLLFFFLPFLFFSWAFFFLLCYILWSRSNAAVTSCHTVTLLLSVLYCSVKVDRYGEGAVGVPSGSRQNKKITYWYYGTTRFPCEAVYIVWFLFRVFIFYFLRYSLFFPSCFVV